MNRYPIILRILLMAVLCYSQIVTSAHFVEHLPQHDHAQHILHDHTLHAEQGEDSRENSGADCSIYHAFSNLNGAMQPRLNIACTVFSQVNTATVLAAALQTKASHHQPIRAPPHFS